MKTYSRTSLFNENTLLLLLVSIENCVVKNMDLTKVTTVFAAEKTRKKFNFVLK